MILAAALLVLVALGLFVWGIATGATALYWACVAVSAVAAVLLVVAFLRMRRVATATEPAGAAPARARASRPGPPAAHAAVPEQGEPAHRPDYPATGPGTSRHTAADGAPAGASSPPPPAAAGPAADLRRERSGSRRARRCRDDDPPVEEVEVTDLLLVVDLHDDVYVVDEHPRYHLADCPWLAGRTGVPLPVDEARTDGFTPCGRCAPDHGLAEVERGRRASRRSSVSPTERAGRRRRGRSPSAAAVASREARGRREPARSGTR